MGRLTAAIGPYWTWPDMNWSDFQLRLRALLFRQAVEDELDEELRFHVDMETRKNIATGMRPVEARCRSSFSLAVWSR